MTFPASTFNTATCLVLSLFAGCGDKATNLPAQLIETVRDLGALAKPPKVIGRDGGPSGLIDGKIVLLRWPVLHLRATAIVLLIVSGAGASG